MWFVPSEETKAKNSGRQRYNTTHQKQLLSFNNVVEISRFLNILAALITKQISKTMSAVKHPPGYVITCHNVLSLFIPQFPRWRFVGALAATAMVAGAIATTSMTPTTQDSTWASLTNPTRITAPPTTINPSIDSIAYLETTTAPQLPSWLDQEVKSGDTLSLIFKRAGYDDQDVHDVISTSQDGKSLERLFPGQTIAFQTDDAGKLVGVRHIKSQLETVTYLRTKTGFESEIDIRAPELREAWTTGVITSSLFSAGQQAGLAQNMILDMANIFGGVVDFALDPRRGDTLQLVYEELYIDGEKFKDGEIIAASFTNQGETFNAFRYTDSHGDTNYYNEYGVSMRKSFLMAPLDFTRISSNFNMKRMHPIYKITRPHRGTDYAAPTGTPVYSAGDGRVTNAGYSGTQGNFVFIQHGDQYTTKYLHLQKRMVNMGQRVSQSQVIGTVGSTGAATGPHLHYEFLVNGVHHNPRTILKDLPKAMKLPEKEMENFRQAINRPNFQLAVLRSSNHLAMNNTAGSKAASN
jgi:murein DD-endopeptidase MepM/ murein hydrolase activator NlpD